MSVPLVTVVTPVLNGAGCIAGCLQSVRTQVVPGAVEHVVVDGGSTDGTRDLLAAAGVRWSSGRDAGIYDAMSRGIRRARGSYVHILNADDRYASPHALARLVAALEGGLDLVHARARQVRADGGVVRTFGRDVPYPRLRRKMVVAHPTVVVRREVYERFGTFSVGFRIAADHEWALRVWRRIRTGFLDEVLIEMRIGGVSTDNANVVRSYRESMAAAVMHGARPLPALLTCWYEIAKHRLFFARRFASATTGPPRPAVAAAGSPAP